MAGPVSFGVCEVCGARVSKSAVKAHLRKCLAPAGEGRGEPLLVVRAESPGTPFYWLEMAVAPGAKLQAIDTLLRRVWLECCGHLSEFFVRDHIPVAMTKSVEAALGRPGSRLSYLYDFGSGTELALSHTTVVEGTPAKGVRVVVRNEAPVWRCNVCDEPATMVCTAWGGPEETFCCPTHARKYKHGHDMLLPVVNSPRMGVCGYTGPD